MARILIADEIAQEGIDLLARAHEVEVRTKQSEAELIESIRGVSALIVRSQTQVTAPVIAAADALRVIGRAGVGVDNIDVPAATARGIVVANAPLANTLSAAEHAFGLMLAVARNIPQADQSLRGGEWARNAYMGVELAGRTLGIVGLGRIGSEVAARARAFQMRVLGYDPFVSNERAAQIGAELRTLEELFAESDFVTLHTALVDQTRGMVNAALLARAKPGLRLVNTARGALVDEQALYDAVESGQLGGAGIDVYSKEPAVGNVLTTHPRIVVTPHLAASTQEAQDRAAVTVAEQVEAVLAGGSAAFAVNAPAVDPEALAVLGPYIDAATLAARVAAQLAPGAFEHVTVEYAGEIANHDVTPLRAAVIGGLLHAITDTNVSMVNADHLAEQRGLRIEETTGPARAPFTSLVVVQLHAQEGGIAVAATQTEHGVEVVRVDQFEVDLSPQRGRYVVALENVDQPGMIGRVGQMLGEWGVNISYMSVGSGAADRALMAIGMSRALTPAEAEALGALPHIFSVRQVDLG